MKAMSGYRHPNKRIVKLHVSIFPLGGLRKAVQHDLCSDAARKHSPGYLGGIYGEAGRDKRAFGEE
jgi:hypothetical protein